MGLLRNKNRRKYIFLFSLIIVCFISPKFVFADKTMALEVAKSFLEAMPFSRNGLIEQLEFAGFTHEEAEYAADNCGADWDDMAVQSAALYLESSDYSESGLIRQLESSSEGFTHEQAVHGVSVAGKDVDWNEMAVRRAEFYLRHSAFSERGLIRQLESEAVGFTHEQAVYGAAEAGKDVDWFEMAAKSAATYLETGPYSENSLIRLLESDRVRFTHEQAVHGVAEAGKDVDWFEMAAEKAKSYLKVSTYSRAELIQQLESVDGFSHEQAVYGADNSGASWENMITVLAENLDNLFPIHGIEENFMTPEQALYTDIGAETAIQTNTQYGFRNILLFSNPDSLHDRTYISRIPSGHLNNFMYTAEITVNDVFPGDQAGCFIGYVNDYAASLKKEEAAQILLVADGLGVGFYRKTDTENTGTFHRINNDGSSKYTLTIIRFTGQTYAFINGVFAGQQTDVNEGPFQLVYGVTTLKDGEAANCSFDSLSVRKVNNN